MILKRGVIAAGAVEDSDRKEMEWSLMLHSQDTCSRKKRICALGQEETEPPLRLERRTPRIKRLLRFLRLTGCMDAVIMDHITFVVYVYVVVVDDTKIEVLKSRGSTTTRSTTVTAATSAASCAAVRTVPPLPKA